MDDQMEVMFKSNRTGYALGGEVEQVDPVSGNEIPPGSFANEVRDDIPAMLSEGEYVVPADVVRFYGVKFLEDLRTEAKIGLARMEENGRIGGEPTDDNDDLTPEEMALLDEVMSMEDGPVGMAVGGMVGEQTTPAALDPYQQQAVMSQAPVKAAYGIDLNSYDNPYGTTTGDDSVTTFIAGESKYVDAVSKLGDSGIVNKTYIHKDGRSIVVQFLNGQPLGVLPPDFSEFVLDTPANRISVGYGGTTEEEDTDTADSTTDNSNKSDNDNNLDTLGEDVYKAGTEGTVKNKYIEKDGSVNMKQMDIDFKNSKVNLTDPLAGATEALKGGGSKVDRGTMGVLGALGVPALTAGYAGYSIYTSAKDLANARSNLQAAKFFNTNNGEDAKLIQKQIDDFLAKSPKLLQGKIGEALASGDNKFQDALDFAMNIDAPIGAMPDYKKLNKIGKDNVNKVLLESYGEGATIGDNGTIYNPFQTIDPSATFIEETDSGVSVFKPGEDTIRPGRDPRGVHIDDGSEEGTFGNTDPLTRNDDDEPESIYEKVFDKPFADTNLGKFLGGGNKEKTITAADNNSNPISANPKTINGLRTSSGQVSVNKTNTAVTGSISDDGNWQQVVNPGTNAITRKWVGGSTTKTTPPVTPVTTNSGSTNSGSTNSGSTNSGSTNNGSTNTGGGKPFKETNLGKWLGF